MRIDNVVHPGLERISAIATAPSGEDLDFLLSGIEPGQHRRSLISVLGIADPDGHGAVQPGNRGTLRATGVHPPEHQDEHARTR